MKILITFLITFISFNAFAKQEQKVIIENKALAIIKQAQSDIDAMNALQKELDISTENNQIIKSGLSSNYKSINEDNAKPAKQEEIKIKKATKEAQETIRVIEDDIKQKTNRRQGFGTVR